VLIVLVFSFLYCGESNHTTHYFNYYFTGLEQKMDINNILTFIIVATLLVISPGPNGLLITKTVPLFGAKAGFANIGGFVIAFYVHGTLSIFGISLLLVQSSQAFFIFKMLGAIYLIWIGVKSLMSAFKGQTSKGNSPKGRSITDTAPTEQSLSNSISSDQGAKVLSVKSAFIEGFLTNVLNPKVCMFYLAAFPQFMSIKDNVLSAYVLVTAHSSINFIWFSCIIFMLSRIKNLTNNGGFKRWLSSITGIVFIGFGTKLALMKNN